MTEFIPQNIITFSLILGLAPVTQATTLFSFQDEAKTPLIAQTTNTDRDRLTEAKKLYQAGLFLFRQGTKESLLQALEKWQQALPILQAVKESNGEAFTLSGIGRIYNSLGEKAKALDYYERALTIFHQINNRQQTAVILNDIGSVYDSLGKKKQALAYYSRALPISQAIGDRKQTAITLNNLGLLYYSVGEIPTALTYYEKALPLSQAVGDRKQTAITLINLGGAYDLLGKKQQALDYYERALTITQSLGNRQGEATILNNIGYVYYSLGNMETALDYYNRVLPISQAIGDRRQVAITGNNIGLVYNLLGEKQRALAYYKQALPVFQQIGDRRSEATTLISLGQAYNSLGDKQKALDYYHQSLPISQAIGDRRRVAITISNIGLVYKSLGELAQALAYYERALPILQQIGDRGGEAITLNNIAGVYNSTEEKSKAIDYLERALAIRQAIGDRYGVANTLNNLGLIYYSLGESQKALDLYNQALPISREIGDRVGESTTLNNLGLVYYSLGDSQQALDYYEQTLTLSQKIGDRNSEATTLANIAILESDRQNYEAALASIDRSLAIVEQIRNHLVSSDLKASYFATVEDYYKQKIEILMELHRQNPDKGYDVMAFETSERGKARSLLELLQEANIDVRQDVAPELIAKEKQLQNRLDAIEKRRISLCSQDCSDRLFKRLETDRSQTVEEYKRLKARIRANSPEYAELTQPQPIDLQKLQKLLDRDTVLWQYSLGRDRSYVWAISKKDFTSYELPSREAIETVARKYHELLEYPSKSQKLNPVATQLSQLVLPPTEAASQKSRVVIVADGALQYVPFASLPIAEERSLLTRHQIINLPSSSVIARLRTNLKKRKKPKKQIAIFADPIFNQNDTRLPQTQASGTEDLGYDPLRSAIRSFDLSLARLPGTKKEAEAILSLIPESEQTSVFDFDANLEFATSKELSDYNIVHFATHGILNSKQPELSGIVLSLFNQEGKPQNGFLRLHEVFNLNLPADLVVLSACETGLGKEIKGEGLVGLTRGFMYAGANKVLVSLWSVDDAATAEFMSLFYRFMLEDELTPAAALNATQATMQKHSQWSHPYYWAAFTLQGNWRSR